MTKPSDFTNKPTPVDADKFPFVQSPFGVDDERQSTWAQIKTTLTAELVAGLAPLLEPGVFHVQDEKTVTNGGGASIAGTQTRDLNEEKKNTITGASLATNQITLPAGDYKCEAVSAAFDCGRNYLILRDTTGAADLLQGINAYGSEATDGASNPSVSGYFTLSVESVLELQHYTESVRASVGLGVDNQNTTEIYSSVIITEVS